MCAKRNMLIQLAAAAGAATPVEDDDVLDVPARLRLF